MRLDRLCSKDVLSGLLFLAAGLGGGILSLGLPPGDSVRMGPGYMPLALSVILSGLGLLVLVRGLLEAHAATVAWQARPVFFVLAAAATFGLTVERAGLLVSVFLMTLVAAAALRNWRRVEAVALAAGLSIFSVLLFVMLLRLPISALP